MAKADSAANSAPPVEGTQPPPPPAGPVEARVLSDCELGKAGMVVQVPAEVVAGYERGGWIDCHPDAVAYARALPQNQPAEPAAVEYR